MNHPTFAGKARTLRASRRVALAAALAAAPAAHAATDVVVWHTLAGAHRQEFEALAKDFNKEQKDVRVVLKAFADQDALRAEAAKAGKSQRPHLVQLSDNHSPEVIAEHDAILPMHRLLAAHPIKDLAWFLPQTTSFVRDAKGQLLAFPFMAEVPVMFYNLDAFKKAGLDPKRPARTWVALQTDLIQLRAAGYACPYATSQEVAVHFENLAAVNKKPYSTNDNGFGKGAPALRFDSLYMRHLSMMVTWKRSLLLAAHTPDNGADARFAKGECAVLTSGTGALGTFLQAKGLSFGVAPLPYYEQVSREAGQPFVSGSALWALAGHGKDEDKATAAFLAFLAKPVVAARWHQRTGFLPLTQAAFAASDVSFYQRIPGAHSVIAAMRTSPGETSRGFRLPNYPRVASLLATGFDAALEGGAPPMQVLNQISDQSKAIMQQRR